MTKRKLRDTILRLIARTIEADGVNMSIIDIVAVLKKFNLRIVFEPIRRKK